MKLVKWIIVTVIVITIAFFFGEKFPYSVQKGLAQSLSSISSILFGVLGIWAGVMAPEKLKEIYTADNHNDRESNWKDLEFLFRPIFLSLGVFSLSTIYIFIGEILKQVELLSDHILILRRISFFYIIYLFIITLILIKLSIRPGFLMLSKSMRYIKNEDRKDRLFQNLKKKK